ncbi:MAG TPA: alpha/beta hydrolase [Elusimicrobiota bacterium]|nr:alpha/beta hydrolase [Elusimicrobiota bacterium]
MKRAGGIAILVLIGLMPLGCSPFNFFYYPNRRLYNDPDRLGIKNQTVSYPSLNGRTLYAVFFPADQKPKGTIVHFHGNFGNVSNHFPLALFLTRRGYDVLSFDYEGYGASEGRPTPDRTIADGIASVRYARDHVRTPGAGVAIFAQSLGGAIGIVVAAREPEVRGAVIEAAFSSYRRMGEVAMKRHFITWPLLALAPFIGRVDDPLRWISHIAPRPVLLIHGDQDAIVPVGMSKELFAAARDPKQLWIVPGAGHLEVHRVAGSEYENRIADFFDRALGTPAHQ